MAEAYHGPRHLFLHRSVAARKSTDRAKFRQQASFLNLTPPLSFQLPLQSAAGEGPNSVCAWQLTSLLLPSAFPSFPPSLQSPEQSSQPGCRRHWCGTCEPERCDAGGEGPVRETTRESEAKRRRSFLARADRGGCIYIVGGRALRSGNVLQVGGGAGQD